MKFMNKWIVKEELKKKICCLFGLLLIPLSLVLYPVSFFKTMTGPARKVQQVPATSTNPDNSAALSPEGPDEKPVGEGGGAAVSRGGTVNRSDVILLAQVIEGEAADEPYSGKVAVGAVIINRTESPDYPKTIPGVVYEEDAFESVSNGQYQRPVTDEALKAATEAVNGVDPVGGALYFWNPAKSTSQWVYTRQIIAQIGGHVFAR